jgi:SAM-dependent methyltransferase
MTRKARRAAQGQDRSGLQQSSTDSPGGLRAVPFSWTSHQQQAVPSAEAAGHIAKGNRHLGQGEPHQAISCFLRAIELQPDQMDAHHSLCAVLLAQGEFEAVAGHFEQILAVRPDYLQGYDTWAMALLGAGDAMRALEVVRHALQIAETAENKSLFVCCLRRLQTIPASDEMRALVMRAMSEPWGRPEHLVGPCLDLIKADRNVAEGIARAEAAWPTRLPAHQLFGPAGPAAVARNPILRCLLENARTDDIALERYLTSARLCLLEAAAAAQPRDLVDDDALAFYCALARQCFINEYIYPYTDRERAQFEALRDALAAALRWNGPVPMLWPIAIAAYAPLHGLPGAKSLLGRDLPDCVDALLTQQIREPAEEQRLHGAIPLLTPVDDEVSVLVQAQYEESPYPRWVRTAPAGGTATIDERLRRQFPFSKFTELERTGAVNVLVAGCGTGRRVVDVALRIAHARVLAIDLSRTRLSYARRQTDALGLTNVDYGQAGILQFGLLGRSFDVIECGSVLHHLGDPEAGWSALASLLRPNGVIRVNLHGELPEGHHAAVGALAASWDYHGSAEEIRQFRQDVLALPEADPVRRLAQNPDFFGLSEFRDLVVHARPHRFTLLQVKRSLAAHDLEFLGFELDAGVLARYGRRYPDDLARADLDRWHAFEQDHPEVFGGMYQFWVQKRP